MNFPIAILLFCTMCGLVDKIIGGRFGLAEEFDRGMTMMGSLSLTMAGIYCFAVMLGRALAAILQIAVAAVWPHHSGQQCARGGHGRLLDRRYPLHRPGAENFLRRAAGIDPGLHHLLLAAYRFGKRAVRGFTKTLMTGTAYGIIATPAALIVGGLMAGIGLSDFFTHLLPVVVICAVLGLCIFYGGERAVGVFQKVGKGINILAIVLFALVVVQSFSTPRRFSLLTRR